MRLALLMVLVTGGILQAAQAPAPFPTPRTAPAPAATPPRESSPATPAPASTTPAPPPVASTPQAAQPPAATPPAAQPPATTASSPGTATTAAPDLGAVPLYPSAVYLRSYDAGRGQKFHLYGLTLSYGETVAYYQAALKNKGDRLFESPPTHQFELGRFRENEMAFPPSVTVKDFTWGGSAGYVNPHAGGQPARFPTVVQIVPAPAPATTRP
jgi:hypothetical protein